MGRTIPPFRIAILLEERRWNSYKLKLEKEDRKIFSQMFSIPSLYNTACTCSIKPIRIHPIFMSIMLYHYKLLHDKGDDNSKQYTIVHNNKKDITLDKFFNQNIYTVRLSKEIQSWQKFSIGLRKNDRELFSQMLKSCYDYSSSIKTIGNERSTESLFITILFEQHKQLETLSY